MEESKFDQSLNSTRRAFGLPTLSIRGRCRYWSFGWVESSDHSLTVGVRMTFWRFRIRQRSAHCTSRPSVTTLWVSSEAGRTLVVELRPYILLQFLIVLREIILEEIEKASIRGGRCTRIMEQ